MGKKGKLIALTKLVDRESPEGVEPLLVGVWGIPPDLFSLPPLLCKGEGDTGGEGFNMGSKFPGIYKT